MSVAAQEFTWFVPAHGFVPEVNPHDQAPFEDLRQAILRPADSPTDTSWSLRFGTPGEGTSFDWSTKACPALRLKTPITSILIEGLKEACYLSPFAGAVAAGSPGRTYEPLRECPGLFDAVARIEPTLQGILSFSAKYGSLKSYLSLWEWQREIEAMRHVVSVWKILQRRDQALLHEHFRWEPGYKGEMSVVYYSDPEDDRSGDFNRIASETSPAGLWELLKDRDVTAAAQLYLMQAINKRVNDNVTSEVVWDKTSRSLTRALIPKNLLGAVWLQFEAAATGTSEQRACRVCGRWFEVSLDAARSDKHYCQDACRSKAYRERQAQARELWADGDGKSLKEIAEQLEVDEKTVRGWVSRKGKRKEK